MIPKYGSVETRNPRIKYDPVTGSEMLVHKCGCNEDGCQLCHWDRFKIENQPKNREERRKAKHEAKSTGKV